MTEKDLIQSLITTADQTRAKLLLIDGNAKLCDLHKVATALEKLDVAVDTCIANSTTVKPIIPPELVQQASDYLTQNPNCTLAELQRHFKISFPTAGRLWEMLRG